jgi:hypothetical protein
MEPQRAEHLWNRPNAIDFTNASTPCAATPLLWFISFLIVGRALAGRSAAQARARIRASMNRHRSTSVARLRPRSPRANVDAGTALAVFFV